MSIIKILSFWLSIASDAAAIEVGRQFNISSLAAVHGTCIEPV
jgi:hypothetical protein